MQVGLFDSGQRHQLNFEPSAHTWRKQNGDFLIGHQTNLPGILASVFVKKWARTSAPGQRLMMQSIQQPLPHTPRILGHAAQAISSQKNSSPASTDHYYFLESLPKSYKLLDDLIATKRLDPEKAKVRLNHLLIQTNVGLNVAKAAAAFLAEVNKREFVYPDFTQKNIMVDVNTGDVKFIDIDSCLPSSELRPDIPDMSSKFAVVYWGAWLQKIGKNQTATTLSQTMVLSFAAIWARAVAMLRAAPDDIESVQKLLRNPGFPEQQAPLWDSLEANDPSAFQKFFLLRDQSDSNPCFEQWKALSESLKRGAVVPWPTITAIIEQTFVAAQSAAIIISHTKKAEVRAPIPPIQQALIHPSTDYSDIVFSFTGRINRLQYLAYTTVQIVTLILYITIALYVVENFGPSSKLTSVSYGFTIMWIVSLASVNVRRSHDYSSNGLVQSVGAIGPPIIIFIAAITNPQGAAISDGYGIFFLLSILYFIVVVSFNCLKRGSPNLNSYS